MKSYGQFCSMARTLDLLGERWTLLIVRELLWSVVNINALRPRLLRPSPPGP